MHLLFQAYAGSDFFGKLIFLALFVLSLLTWTLLLQKWLFQRHAKSKSFGFAKVFEKHRFDPLSLQPEISYPFAHLYAELKQVSLQLLKKNQRGQEGSFLSASDIELTQAGLKNIRSLEMRKIEKNLFLLSTIASLAPFLGLLGTVWGILLTLEKLQVTAGLQSSRSFMGDLSMALGTTVFGLLVAIPALVGHNYLRSSLREFSTDMENFSQLLLSSVALQYRKIDV